jgi:hypothetical protein
VPAFFGWLPSYKAGDLYNSLIGGSPTFNSAIGISAINCVTANALTTANNSIYVARSSSQTGGAISCNGFTLSGNGTNYTPGGSATPLGYPNGPDGALWVAPLWITDGLTSAIRGRVAGTFVPLHNVPLGLYDPSTNMAGLPGVTGLALPAASTNSAGEIIVDITGPW